VALNPASPLALIEEIVDDLDLLLIMSVNPGFGGQTFIQASIDKVRRARRLLDDRGRSDVIVQVDGGVSAGNVRLLVEAGATCLVAGSSVFGHPEGVAQAVEEFRDALR
jgi:ribulose-phosphate 3-epimerase